MDRFSQLIQDDGRLLLGCGCAKEWWGWSFGNGRADHEAKNSAEAEANARRTSVEEAAGKRQATEQEAARKSKAEEQ